MGLIGFFGGAIGWMVTGSPLGGLLGYVLGSLFDGNTTEEETYTTQSEAHNAYSGTTYQQRPQAASTTETARDNFIFSLLVLTAAVIKADGKVMHSEMEYVRRFFRTTFNEAASRQANDILLTLFKQNIDINACGAQIAANMDYTTRLQLLDYLTGIAKADGRVTPDEVLTLRNIARALLVDAREIDSLLNLGTDTLEAAYKVLEVAPDVSNDELKRAYKRLVLKHHPDRVATLGDDIRQRAEEKLKQINDAYEKVSKSRGL